MAVKTITIDLDAYERLARLKKPGQSFSQVIKEHVIADRSTAGDLLAALEATSVSEETLDAIDKVIAERGKSRARVPRW